MKQNGFTYVLCLYITALGITTMLGATSIFQTKIQMEKQLQNHYLASTILNLSTPNNIPKIQISQKSFTERHNNAILWYNWAESSEDSITYAITIQLDNGYTSKQTICWNIKTRELFIDTK
ncbi:hypothetical protein HCC18_02990 [Listeria booriae]|uniref:hypothetical protein n=1 Tax=Listeria booriae TaxID=1552123 RepID=UPI0016282410|nr:hypothetical protein [Listeria booriae]MBC2315797.1 hypothetical protein [Listeria booriae]